MSDLNITTRHIEDIVILDLEGRIQLGETSANLHQTLKTQVDEGKRQIVINLAKVTAIDSSGLGSLIAGYATLEKNDGELKLVNLSERVSELMTITKLFTVFDIFENEQDAIASFTKVPESTTQPREARAATDVGSSGNSLL